MDDTRRRVINNFSKVLYTTEIIFCSYGSGGIHEYFSIVYTFLFSHE